MSTIFCMHVIRKRCHDASRAVAFTLLPTMLAFLATGCASKPTVSPMIEAHGLAFQYDGARDRLIYFGPANGPNLLEVRNLEQLPDPGGDYTFYGGHYNWIAPQNLWRNVDGELMNWPPEPIMDRGPRDIEIDPAGVLRAIGSKGRAGLTENTTFEIVDDSTFRVRQTLRNDSDLSKRAAIWSITAAKPRCVIAVPMDTRALFAQDEDEIRLDNNQAKPLWNSVARLTDDWMVIDTGIGLAVPGWDPDSFKAFLAATEGTRIAIWSDGYWLLRSGEPVDVFHSLDDVGESAVEVYANFGMRLFEAELLGPFTEIKPGEETHFDETWTVIPSPTPDVDVLGR